MQIGPQVTYSDHNITFINTEESQLLTVTGSVFPAQPQVACNGRSLPLECQCHWLWFPYNWTLEADVKPTQQTMLFQPQYFISYTPVGLQDSLGVSTVMHRRYDPYFKYSNIVKWYPNPNHTDGHILPIIGHKLLD